MSVKPCAYDFPLIVFAQCPPALTVTCRQLIGHKSKILWSRQAGNSAEVIAYADRGNTRMRSKYHRMIRHGKKKNVAVAATARELVCFVWGIMTNNIEPRTERVLM